MLVFFHVARRSGSGLEEDVSRKVKESRRVKGYETGELQVTGALATVLIDEDGGVSRCSTGGFLWMVVVIEVAGSEPVLGYGLQISLRRVCGLFDVMRVSRLRSSIEFGVDLCLCFRRRDR